MDMPEPSAAAIAIDLMVIDATLVTMDAQRRIIKDGAIAVHDGIIVAIGKSADLKPKYQAHETIDGRRFVITPGLVNTHVHVTDERLASQCAALEMLRTGTTCFLEAGTIRFLDSVVDGLTEIGIRGRVGQWAWDFNPQDQSHPKAATDAAIRLLDDEIARYPAGAGQRIAAWPILIGHMTCSGDLWRAAKNLADRHGVGVGAHMSPVQADPDWFLARHGCRPIEYLHQIDALGSNTVFTHAVHLNDSEVALLADAGASIAHCATSALKGAYGATAV